MAVVTRIGFVLAATAALIAVFGALAVRGAAPEDEVGPDGRVPAWVEDERSSSSVSASRPVAAG